MRYSLRSLMIVVALIAVPLGWWSNRVICGKRAWYYYEQACDEDVQHNNVCSHDLTIHQSDRLKELSKHHLRLCNLYIHAVNRPWEMWWIDETPPQEQPMTAKTRKLKFPDR